jgi:hypothetical protein
MNLYLSGLIWVLGVGATACVGTILVHRFMSADARSSNDAVGVVFSIVGGLHAVLMAFVLISLFDAVSTIREGSHTEANSLVAVYWAGDSLPEPAKGQIQDLAKSYTRTVIDQEWPKMRDGEAVSGPGWAILDRMRAAIDSASAESDWQQARKAEAASQLWNVYQARQARITAAGSQGVSTVVWLALIVGSLMSLSLPYLLDVRKLVTHMILMSAMAGTIALLLFAIYQLQNPFSGGAKIGPDAFNSVLGRLTSGNAG